MLTPHDRIVKANYLSGSTIVCITENRILCKVVYHFCHERNRVFAFLRKIIDRKRGAMIAYPLPHKQDG
jgi:hypothetical protein